jgi:hypothetical protein
MKTSIKLIGITALITVMFQTAHADPNPAEKAKFQEARQTCAEKLNLSFPLATPMDQKTRMDFDSCMQGEGITFHRHHHHWKEIQACLTQANVTIPTFTPGVRPTLTDAQKTAIKTCRAQIKAAKGTQPNATSTQ